MWRRWDPAVGFAYRIVQRTNLWLRRATPFRSCKARPGRRKQILALGPTFLGPVLWGAVEVPEVPGTALKWLMDSMV